MNEQIHEELRKLFNTPHTIVNIKFRALKNGVLEMTSYAERGKMVSHELIPFIRQADEAGTTVRLAKPFGGYNDVELPDDFIDEYSQRLKSKRPKKEIKNRGKRSKLSSFTTADINRQVRNVQSLLLALGK